MKKTFLYLIETKNYQPKIPFCHNSPLCQIVYFKLSTFL